MAAPSLHGRRPEDHEELLQVNIDATLTFLEATVKLKPRTMEQLREWTSNGAPLKLSLLRDLGADGICELLKIEDKVDILKILATEGEAPVVPPEKPPPAKLITFELQRVSFMQIKSIDPVAQMFGATVYFVFKIPGGATDPDISPWLTVDSNEPINFPRCVRCHGSKLHNCCYTLQSNAYTALILDAPAREVVLGEAGRHCQRKRVRSR